VLKEANVISKRQELVLRAIVEEYVKTNEPVGSKSLVNNPNFDLNVSPATIRNDMSDLEDLGLIVKTHSSSGRVPSEAGYRTYVEILLKKTNNKVEDFPLIDEIFKRDFISREEAIKESMTLITELTNYASVVLGPQGLDSKIKKIQMVSLDNRHGVILLVTDQGYVESRKIFIPEGMNFSEIEKIVLLLNKVLYDCPISRIDEKINESLQDKSFGDYLDFYDDLISVFIRIFTEMAHDKVYLSGQNSILSQPEFQDVNRVKELLYVIESQEILKVVNATEQGVTVRIGNENTIKAMKDYTVISVPYELDDGKSGTIAVIGPTRMEYKKIIPLLEYIAKNIKKVI
jgi:heat-inducible transcriptional repressor